MFRLWEALSVVGGLPLDKQLECIDALRKRKQIKSHILNTTFGLRLMTLTDHELERNPYAVEAMGITKGVPGAPSIYITIKAKITRLLVIYAAFYMYEYDQVNTYKRLNAETRGYTKHLDLDTLIAFSALDVDVFLVPFVIRELAKRAETIDTLDHYVDNIVSINPRFNHVVILYFALEHAIVTKQSTARVRNRIDNSIQTGSDLEKYLPVFLPLAAASNQEDVVEWWLTTMSIIWNIDREMSIVTSVNYLAGEGISSPPTLATEQFTDPENLQMNMLRLLSSDIDQALEIFHKLSTTARYPPRDTSMLETLAELER